MSKIMRIKFQKTNDMIYISHLDIQRLFQRVFRRAGVELSFSQGFNPHPKMSYGNALALGVESLAEYVDVEIEDDISSSDLIARLNDELPNGMTIEKCVELVGGEKSLAANIEYGDYEFRLDNINTNSKEETEEKIKSLMSMDEVMVSKKNKKGKIVDVDIRPMIKEMNILEVDEKNIVIGALLATGSKQNLNTNVFLPKLIEYLGINIDALDVDILRKGLYFYENEKLVSPL